MENTIPTTTERIENIGPDRVIITAQEVAIEAKHPMPDWHVREMNHIPVYFEDRKYYLVEQRRAQPPFAERYLLLPWPEDMGSNAKTFYSYDAEAVAEREGQLSTGRFESVIRACLLPFYPVLGFLWSGTQKRLMRFGFMPHSITGVSLFTGFCLLFGELIFLSVLINASLRSGKLMFGGLLRALVPWDHFQLGPVSIPVAVVDLLLVVAVLVDVCVRFGRHFHEDQWAGGFLEWLLPRSREARAGVEE